MNLHDIVSKLLKGKQITPQKEKGEGRAPSNVALCKYWGKREELLRLPVNSSLSISLGSYGTTTTLQPLKRALHDVVTLNEKRLPSTNPFVKRLVSYLNLFRDQKSLYFHINTHNTLPTAAGLASSASGFASLVLALNDLFHWKLNNRHLSILARLGSGSACRSLFHGFVQWKAGIQKDGMDSYAFPLDVHWPELCIGILVLEQKRKTHSSQDMMAHTVSTSPFYSSWSSLVRRDLTAIKKALASHDFPLLGEVAEGNALAMHAMIIGSRPSFCYFSSQTTKTIHKIWKWRQKGIPLFFTQDAGPNIKLLFLEKDSHLVRELFPQMLLVKPFDYVQN